MRFVIRITRVLCVAVALCGFLAGCHSDETGTPQNQALTQKRQEIIKRHKEETN